MWLLLTVVCSYKLYLLTYKKVHICEYLLLTVNSIKAVSVKLGVVICAVNSEETDETHNGCLQLDDDNEFPAIGRSAFIY